MVGLFPHLREELGEAVPTLGDLPLRDPSALRDVLLAGQFALFDMLIYEVLGQFYALLGPLGEMKIQLTLLERVFRIR